MVGRLRAPIFSKREVGCRIDADDIGTHLALVGEDDRDIELLDRDATCFAGDDVVVREDEAVGADDHAGAEAVLDSAPRAEERVRVAEDRSKERIDRRLPPHDLLRRDVDDRRDDSFGDAAEVGAACSRRTSPPLALRPRPAGVGAGA